MSIVLRALRSRAGAAMAAAGLATMSSGVVVLSASSVSADPEHQVWVCKYVGKPDVNLQAHHIESVGQSALGQGFTSTYPTPFAPVQFADKHGHSVAIGWVIAGAATPGISACAPGAGDNPGGVDDGSGGVKGVLAPLQFQPIDRCGVYGSITRPADTDFVTYSIDGNDWRVQQGTHTVRAMLTGGATSFTDAPAGWQVDGNEATQQVALGTYEACAPVVGLLASVPRTSATCAADGTVIPGSVTEPVSDNVAYSIAGGAWSGITSGKHVVTATLTGGASAFGGATDGWDISGHTATTTVDLGPAQKCAPTDTTPPGTGTTPPSTDTTPPSTDTTPPSTDTTPPSTDTTPPKGGTGNTGGSKPGDKGGQGDGKQAGGSANNGGTTGGDQSGSKIGKPRTPEILGVEAESHQPGTTGVSLTGVTTVVSSHKPVSGGVAVPTAVEAGLASYGKPADERSRLFGGLQLTVGGALFLAGGWGLRRRPSRG